MRLGKITADEFRSRTPPCDCRWNTDDYMHEDSLAHRSITSIGDLLDMKHVQYLPGNDVDSSPGILEFAEVIVVIMEPAVVGEKVFLLMLADFAQTNLEEFENSEFNDPAPRLMVNGIRRFAFRKISASQLRVLVDAAYDGENSRSDVSYLGKLALLTRGGETKEFREFLSLVVVRIVQNKTIREAQNIVDRMKEYDAGTVDLTDELTSRPVQR